MTGKQHKAVESRFRVERAVKTATENTEKNRKLNRVKPEKQAGEHPGESQRGQREQQSAFVLAGQWEPVQASVNTAQYKRLLLPTAPTR